MKGVEEDNAARAANNSPARRVSVGDVARFLGCTTDEEVSKFYAFVFASVAQKSWADSAASPTSVAIKMSVARNTSDSTWESRIDAHRDSQADYPTSQRARDTYLAHKELFDTYTDAVYSYTQETLRNGLPAGTQSLTLYRGMQVKTSTLANMYRRAQGEQRPTNPATGDLFQMASNTLSLPWEGDAYEVTAEGDVALHADPLSSWAYDADAASAFGNPDTYHVSLGTVQIALRANTVPITSIWSTALTGPGCLGEAELIVKDSDNQVVHASAKSTLQNLQDIRDHLDYARLNYDVQTQSPSDRILMPRDPATHGMGDNWTFSLDIGLPGEWDNLKRDDVDLWAQRAIDLLGYVPPSFRQAHSLDTDNYPPVIDQLYIDSDNKVRVFHKGILYLYVDLPGLDGADWPKRTDDTGVVPEEVTKGESDGHPFRGNQYTRGIRSQGAGVVGQRPHPRGRGWDDPEAHAEAKRIAEDLAQGRRSSIRSPRPMDQHFKRRVLELLPQYIDGLAKGEPDGHPFRGNQYTRGIDGGVTGVVGRSTAALDDVPTEFKSAQGALDWLMSLPTYTYSEESDRFYDRELDSDGTTVLDRANEAATEVARGIFEMFSDNPDITWEVQNVEASFTSNGLYNFITLSGEIADTSAGADGSMPLATFQRTLHLATSRRHPDGMEMHHDVFEVDPMHQGMGIGGEFIMRSMARARDLGFTLVTLDGVSNGDTFNGAAIWARAGFKIDRRSVSNRFSSRPPISPGHDNMPESSKEAIAADMESDLGKPLAEATEQDIIDHFDTFANNIVTVRYMRDITELPDTEEIDYEYASRNLHKGGDITLQQMVNALAMWREPTTGTVAKGEAENHPFRGNQHTGGIPGGLIGRSAAGHDLSQNNPVPTEPVARRNLLKELLTKWTLDPAGIRIASEEVMGRASHRTVPDNPVDGGEYNAKLVLDYLRDNAEPLKQLWRGVTPGEDAARELKNLVVGESIDIPVLGASRVRSEAAGHFHGSRPGGVLFHILDPYAVAIAPFSSLTQYESEDEWITGGRFKVVSIEQKPAELRLIRRSSLSDQFDSPELPEGLDPNAPMTIVTLQHEAMFDSDLGPGETRGVTPAPEPTPEPAPAPQPAPAKRGIFRRLMGG